MPDTALDHPEIVITRTFDAPREHVWKALSEAESLRQWWGPKGMEMGDLTLDFRPGGVFHYSMSWPGQPAMWGIFKYKEIVPMEKIVFINGFSDVEGGMTPNPYIAVWPLEVLNTLTLDEKEGPPDASGRTSKTTITMRGGPINATPEQIRSFADNASGMQEGFAGTWEQLDAYLKTL